MQEFNTSIELLKVATNESLYELLIAQLNKDFALVNIEIDFSQDLNPIELKEKLQNKIKLLIENDFDNLLNLLYTIDVSESEIKNMSHKNYTEGVTFLILKRIFKKVWFKSKLS